MLNTQLTAYDDHSSDENHFRFLTNFVRFPARALTGGLLLAVVSLSPVTVQAGDPVSVGVTVTGADGQPVQGASVSVTQSGNPIGQGLTPHRNNGATGQNGTVTFNQGATRGQTAGGPLPAGVYRVEVTHNGKRHATYVHVAEGETGATNVDLSKAEAAETPSTNSFGASGRVERAAHEGDRDAYDTALEDLDRGIRSMEQEATDFEAAIRDFKRDNRIPPGVDSVETANRLLRRIESIEKRDPTAVDQEAKADLQDYRDLLIEQSFSNGFLDALKEARKEVPAFPNQRSAERDDDSHGSLDGLPWLDDEDGAQYANLDRTAENLTSDIATNQGKTIPLHFNLSFHHHY